MALLFRLPVLLIELLVRRLMHRDGDDDVFVPSASPTSTATPTAPPPTAPPAASPPAPETGASFTTPPPTAEEAIDRRFAREAAEAAAPPPTPPTPLRPVADNGHVDREATVVESFGPASDVGSTITVDEPWDGYDGMPAAAVIQRVRGADTATKAVVRLYEQQHKARATVLRATG
jgi:hypothetical protein